MVCDEDEVFVSGALSRRLLFVHDGKSVRAPCGGETQTLPRCGRGH